MAIEPLGAPQPVKLAVAPLAAAREVVRLTQEANQRIREAGLDLDEEAAREARRAAEAAREAEREEARSDEPRSNEQSEAPSDSPGGERRGEAVDILA